MRKGLLASLAKPLWRLLEARQVDARAVFLKHGLDPAQVQQPRTRYPFDSVCQAWMEAQRITNDRNIGLEARKYLNPLDLNALGVTFLSSTNLIEAFQRLDIYESLLNSLLDFTIVEGSDRLDILAEVAFDLGDSAQLIEDTRMASLVSMARLGLSDTLNPVEVAYAAPQPRSTAEHFSVFRCPLTFSQPVSRISFSLADARKPFSAANRELALSNDRFLDEMMKDLNESDLVSTVKRAIIEDLPSGTPNAEDIASRIFLSGRTLQRRLAAEKVSFRDLVAEVRQDLAVKYISDEMMPLAEISYMLGFSDASSFSRAFKRWTGEPPAIYREKLAA